jgi:hypothetical protein
METSVSHAKFCEAKELLGAALSGEGSADEHRPGGGVFLDADRRFRISGHQQLAHRD